MHQNLFLDSNKQILNLYPLKSSNLNHLDEDKRKFVADPVKGSKHNRGCAVDLSVYNLKTGELVPMPSGFDEFTERASPNYKGGSDEERSNREMLRKLMEGAGFTVNPNEWWHFDYKDWEKYAIYDISFDEAAEVKK